MEMGPHLFALCKTSPSVDMRPRGPRWTSQGGNFMLHGGSSGFRSQLPRGVSRGATQL